MTSPNPPDNHSENRFVNTYASLHASACWALECAQNEESDSFYASMHTILASVHSVEAYLNHLGEGVIDGWDERGLKSPRDKFKAVRKHFGVSPQTIDRSYTSYSKALSFRDSLVHGRTHTLKDSWYAETPVERPRDKLRAEWEKLCCPEQAAILFTSCKDLLAVLGVAAGDSPDHMHRLSGGDTSTTGG